MITATAKPKPMTADETIAHFEAIRDDHKKNGSPELAKRVQRSVDILKARRDNESK